MTKIIQLKQPITWFEKPLSSIELREPNGLEYIQLGEPQTLVKSRDGSFYAITNDETIKAYLDKLLILDGGVAVLSALTLADTMQIKNTFLGFFSDAVAEIST